MIVHVVGCNSQLCFELLLISRLPGKNSKTTEPCPSKFAQNTLIQRRPCCFLHCFLMIMSFAIAQTCGVYCTIKFLSATLKKNLFRSERLLVFILTATSLRWCTTSDLEQQKCYNISQIAKNIGNPLYIVCVPGN